MSIDSDWDYYTADATVTITGGGPTRMSSPPPRRLSYHTERLLGPDGWTTTISYTTVSGEGNPIAKMIVNADGTVQYFDAEGRAVSPPAVNLPTSLPKAAPPSVRKPQTSDLRAWIDNIIVGPTNRDRMRTRLERGLGTPIRDDRGFLRYRAARTEAAVEVLFDPSRGVVNEENLSRNGKLVSRTTYAYNEVAPGVLVMASKRVERAGDNNVRPLTVEQTLSNVQVLRRGGK
jgi:hypothetical protein